MQPGGSRSGDQFSQRQQELVERLGQTRARGGFNKPEIVQVLNAFDAKFSKSSSSDELRRLAGSLAENVNAFTKATPALERLGVIQQGAASTRSESQLAAQNLRVFAEGLGKVLFQASSRLASSVGRSAPGEFVARKINTLVEGDRVGFNDPVARRESIDSAKRFTEAFLQSFVVDRRRLDAGEGADNSLMPHGNLEN